jgi:hypothetical protein
MPQSFLWPTRPSAANISLQIGQLILEYGSWVHLSLVVPDKPQNRILTRTASGYSVGVA